MFVREKRIGAYRYLYLVETVREDGKTKQRIIQNLGRNGIDPRPGEAVCSSGQRRAVGLAFLTVGSSPRTFQVVG